MRLTHLLWAALSVTAAANVRRDDPPNRNLVNYIEPVIGASVDTAATYCYDSWGSKYNPGSYACNYDRRGIYTCSPSGTWVLSADCGTGSTCKISPDNGLPFCDPRVNELAERSQLVTNCKDANGLDYPLGFYGCNVGRTAIIVCSPSGEWVKSSECGPGGQCKYNPTNWLPFCDPRVKEVAEGNQLDATSTPVPPQKVSELDFGAAQTDCEHKGIKYRPGTLGCGNNGSGIFECAGYGQWVLWIFCGKANYCKQGVGLNIPYCDCPKSEAEEDTTKREEPTRLLDPPDVEPKSEVSNAAVYYCQDGRGGRVPPGTYLCGWENRVIYVCDWDGRWKASGDCGKKDCCRSALCTCPADSFPYIKDEDLQSIDLPPDYNVTTKRDVELGPFCVPPGFSDEDHCLNVCGPRYPPCFAYCTCKSTVWPLETRIPILQPKPASTALPTTLVKVNGRNKNDFPFCTPPGFRDEDSCLNVCGPRYPPCFAYCTCKSKVWPLSSRNPTAAPSSVPTKLSV
ncbi:hypothetical protein BU24DRAFT_467105 [Aaosphaeria arxii CBS 175.79]|uniref:Uncharacterized protein n=1 Tax=Aaosphaeria arxii CBS 175.79 TaxID=1450172 RepID=A0A6A5XC49_9PLEO|nr:uncharacterized protein BU24DRAFT_467105 [Aaosphaeria arxii CBS 175.79]KAF2010471.1 hypothetical protein BU24DRAFT_467105 [Aaosphaeria arxii CBS 175.79]